MAVVVQKYGGTSVANLENIRHVAKKVAETQQQGDQVVVVVSAMAGETDRLFNLAQEITTQPNPRELDVLVSTGEQVSIALLTISLIELGCSAKSYTASQIGIITDSAHNKARIVDINHDRIQDDLNNGYVVVVAGYQGIDNNHNITTLGRGGSDTTAVALAAALSAEECRIYTDVEGVYTTDPRVVPNATKLDQVTFEEMLEMASLGSKVLQIRAVEFAGKYKVPLRVLSTFKEGDGTLITFEEQGMEQPLVSGIAFSKDEAKLTIRGVPDHPGVAGQILSPISQANIEVDMIIQNIASDEKTTDFTFTVHRNDYCKARSILDDTAKLLQAEEVSGDDHIVKVSIVGVGMRSHAGIANTMFVALGNEGINIQMISTSEIKVSVVMDEKYLELAVRALHEAFELDKP